MRVASKNGLCFRIVEGTIGALLVLRWALVCLSSSQCWHYRCVPPCPAQLQSLIAFYRWGNQALNVYILFIEDEISPKWLSRSMAQTAWAFIASLRWHGMALPICSFSRRVLFVTHPSLYIQWDLQVPSAQWRHILSHGSGVRDAASPQVWAPPLFPCSQR